MKKIQIFSPHIDDAILSLGGSILNWKSRGYEIIVRNVFTISNWTHPKPLSQNQYDTDIYHITALRKNEEREVARNLNFTTEFWDFLDMPLRNGFNRDEIGVMQNQITNRINQCLNLEDYFFLPLGVDHPDHLLLRRLGSKCIDGKFNLYFYEDLPYYSWAKFDYLKVNLSLRKDKLSVLQKIDFTTKEAIIRKYSSQITESYINEMKAYSYSIRDNSYYERYWKQK